ncbi:MAG TPA: hypothetical protein VFX48_05710 [Saprospiraceae bacterium]|nr:hypothetical protein [Saprospiraceae bacterium]
MINGLFRATWLLQFALLYLACRKDSFTTDPADVLRLELDTLRFDTVFSTIGSATRILKIYNPHSEAVLIERAYIPNGARSDFRINIDGVPGNAIENIEIRGGDSIYLFCEVTVNPFDPVEESPFIKLDSILLEYNGNRQRLLLVAYGQNANYIPSKANKGQVAFIDLQGSTWTWDDPKPYVVYGILYIDHGTLVIPAGSRIHVWGGLTKAEDAEGHVFFYNDGRIIIGPDARILVEGRREQPVVFEGVRLESEFKDQPGQWSGIFLEKGSRGNRLEYAVIKNNLIGLAADSLSEVELAQCRIYNNSLYGIYASSSDVRLINGLLYNQGASAVLIQTGGNFEMDYSTLASYGNTEPALYLSNARCIDVPFCQYIVEYPLQARIRNCVIAGSDNDEIWMEERIGVAFKPNFQHSVFRVKELLKPFPGFFADYTGNCHNYAFYDRLFRDLAKDDYHPDSLSIMEQKAFPLGGMETDLDGWPRDPVAPDAGCFEYHVN